MKKLLLLLFIATAVTACKTESVDKISTSDELIDSKLKVNNGTSPTVISFSGYTWNVKNPVSTQGPGPNYWTSDNVWVDANGRLHLKLSKNPVTNRWECAEVSSTTSFGYGTFQWKVDGPLGSLDKNVVFGMFNYSGNDGYDEMDIEYAKWGNAAANNLNYTIYPATGNPNPAYATYTQSISTPDGTYTTQRFKRTANQVILKSLHGFQDGNVNLFASKTFSSPPTSISTASMPIFMNLWLFQGLAPSNNQSVEVIIHEFKYTPL